ncbi:transmembrane protein 81 [Sceloporus undulatus]|uniref:transmembrane protein 81 n=1 Tax=Sceloporus undulatus TaxID=8520 RepID=UPI001C4C8FB2|nr:transmembrane protein 81 [Sceloporus undulatus]
MVTAEASLILGTLALAYFVPLSMASDELVTSPVTIPQKLSAASARVSVSSTSCSTTCGLGYKVEEICQVKPTGERRDCIKRRLDCLSNWICGMVHFTIPVGKPFELSCLTTEEIGPETQSFSYTWRLARGIITTDDALFIPFKTPGFVIKFSPTEEYDAGTYRCDVQLMKTYKIVKRIYFGLRVIPSHLVDLNFDKSLTEEQKLEIKNEKNQPNATAAPAQKQPQSWRQKAVIVFLIGIGSGVVGGVLLHTLLYRLLKSPADYEHVEE